MNVILIVLITLFVVCGILVYIVINYFLYLKSATLQGFVLQTRPSMYSDLKQTSEANFNILNYSDLKHTSKANFNILNNADNFHHRPELNNNLHLYTNPRNEKLQKMVLGVVACGDRLAETLVMIKSAILFTQSPLMIIVMADEQLILSFKEKLNEWRTITNNSFAYEVRPVTFPLQGNTDEWRRLFKPCSSQRLFLPIVLNHMDALLYVDTDTLFLGPVEDLWHHFSLMNASQIAALTPEHEDPNLGYYNRFTTLPYYGKLGVNAGVMLMNLTRMRSFRWTSSVGAVYKKYKLKITLGDQDIINIIFHLHPDKLYIFPCRYNYRTDHCRYLRGTCHSADETGVAVLHGSRETFHNEEHPPFKAIYKAMEEYQLGTDLYSNLFLPMKNYLEVTSTSNCSMVKHIFTKSLQRYLQKVELR